MKEYWHSIHERSLETVAVWEQGAAAFTVGELTLALHKADVASLNATLQAQSEAASALGTARRERDTGYRAIADLCTRGCQVIAGSLPAAEPLRAEVRHVRGVRRESQGALLGKGQRLVSLWQKVNAFRAAMTPPQPALLVGTTGLGLFQQWLEDHSGRLQSVEDMLAERNARKSALRAQVTRLDQNNKRWHLAWRGQFAAGSAERDGLRQISTGPRRLKPARAVVSAVQARSDGRVTLAFDAARGTSFTVLHQGPGETAFTPLPERTPLKSFTSDPLPPGRHAWKVIAHNSAGDGGESAVISVEMPLLQAA